MIRKKWIDGELVLSVETEDEFWKATTTGEPVAKLKTHITDPTKDAPA